MTRKPPPKAPLVSSLGKGTRHPARYKRRVRYSAPVLALTLLTTPVLAQVIPTGSPAADILLSQAITEHRVFLTCSALDPAAHARITESWERDITAAAAVLAANKVPPEAIAAFTTAANPENLMPAPDTLWAEVQGLCATRPDWLAAYDKGSRILLQTSLPTAFQ